MNKKGGNALSILESVNDRYEEFSPAQKRIADYIFKYPDQVCFYSLKELAEDLGVTEVTVLRFVKKIGLSSFVELKKKMREHLQIRLNQGDPLDRVSDWRGKKAEQTGDRDKMFREFAGNEIRILQKTYESLEPRRIWEAVSIIRGAVMVYVVGNELTTGLSSYLTRRLLTIGVRAMDLGNVSRAIYNDYMTHIGPEDAVIIFSVPGYAKHLVNTTKFLDSRRVPQIVLTDMEEAPVASLATTVLTFDNQDLFFYNSVLGLFSLSNLLTYFTAMENLEETNRMRGKISEVRELIGSGSAGKGRQKNHIPPDV